MLKILSKWNKLILKSILSVKICIFYVILECILSIKKLWIYFESNLILACYILIEHVLKNKTFKSNFVGKTQNLMFQKHPFPPYTI
eukprot:UN21036